MFIKAECYWRERVIVFPGGEDTRWTRFFFSASLVTLCSSEVADYTFSNFIIHAACWKDVDIKKRLVNKCNYAATAI